MDETPDTSLPSAPVPTNPAPQEPKARGAALRFALGVIAVAAAIAWVFTRGGPC